MAGGRKKILKKILFMATILFVFLICSVAVGATGLSSDPLRELRENEEIIPQGWEQVEEYWYELEREMGEFLPAWNIRDLLKRDAEGAIPGMRELVRGLLRFLCSEVVINLNLMGQLILLAIVAALLKSLQGAFGSKDVASLTETVIFFVLVGVALRSFALALEIGNGAVENMVNFMLALIPVLLTLLASLGHVTSAGLFHPLIIFAVNFIASLVRNVVFPLIFFATILALVNHFSPHFKINRLADLFKELSRWILGLMLTLFSGLTALQGIAGGVGDALTLKTAKFMTNAFVPVVGKMLSDAVETVMGYSLLLKNTATIAGLLLLCLLVVFPLLKLLVLVAIFKLAGALVQPLGETGLGEALYTMGSCLTHVFAAVVTVALAFFIGISIIVGVSNATMMLR